MAQVFLYILPWLPVIQMTLSALLIVCVLLQARGSDVGGAFGATSAVYRTRRGIEKSLFRATIVLAVLFALISLVRLVT